MSMENDSYWPETAAAPTVEQRIAFGPRPTQNVPVSWAEAMLTGLAKRNPKLFGTLLVEASQVSETA